MTSTHSLSQATANPPTTKETTFPTMAATRFALRCAKESGGTISVPNLCIGTWAWGDKFVTFPHAALFLPVSHA